MLKNGEHSAIAPACFYRNRLFWFCFTFVTKVHSSFLRLMATNLSSCLSFSSYETSHVKARQTLYLVLTFTDVAHWSSHLTNPKAKQTRANHHRLHTKVIKEDGGHLRELVGLNKKAEKGPCANLSDSYFKRGNLH